MDKTVVALTKLIAHPEARSFPSPASITVDLETAPACVVALAQAMATHPRNLNIGEFSVYAGTPMSVHILDSIEMSDIELDELDPADRVDPEATLQLGADGGGMSELGLTWTADGQISFLVVEIDDPTPETLIQRFTTPAELLGFLEREGEEIDAKIRAMVLGEG